MFTCPTAPDLSVYFAEDAESPVEWLSPDCSAEYGRKFSELSAGRVDCFDMEAETAHGNAHCVLTLAKAKPLGGYMGTVGLKDHISAGTAADRKQLQETNQLLQALLDNIPCAFFVKDADDDYRYLMSNQTYAGFLSTTCEYLYGKTDDEFYLPNDVATCHESDLQAMEAGHSDADEVVTIKGAQYVLRCIKNRIVRNDGHRLLLGICVDITNERVLQKELREAMDVQKVYVEQEHLLNQCLGSVMLNEGEDSAISIVMKMIGERLKADHAYCFKYDYQCDRIVPMQEWAGDGQKKRENFIPDMSINQDEGWFKLFLERKILCLPDVSKPEAKAVHGSWAGHMEKIGVRSLYAMPVWCENELWGHIGLSYTASKGELSESEMDLVQSCAHIVEMILERRNKRDELNRSEYEKLLIMDSIKIPIMLFNPEMHLMRCNNAALEIAGIPEAQVYRQDCWETFCKKGCRPADCPVCRVINSMKESDCEMRIRDRDFLLSAYPIMIDGKLLYIMKTMIDITELNAAKERLAAALEEARDASKAKSYFLATMSHELRTPLNAVIGFSELLQNERLPQNEYDDYIHSINLAGNSLLMLINDVLDLSKLEAGQAVLTSRATDLTKTLEELRAVFQYKVKRQGLSMSVKMPENMPLLSLDSLRLRQILLNLIGNAVKFTEKGGIDISVVFEAFAKGRGKLTIAVRDTGIGISPEACGKIFAPFVQSDATRDSHAYKGTGLGLAISKRLAEQMGGCIRLESELGKGSCFTLELNGVETVDGDPAKNAKKEIVPCHGGMSANIRVLLVDDVEMNLKVLQAMMRKMNIESVSAISGAEALEILNKDNGFDMVLTDLWMPEMNGMEFANKLKEVPGCGKIPVIAVTADTEVKQNFDMEAFAGMLLKPITIAKMEELFNKCAGVKSL